MSSLRNKKVLLGVTGSVAAYKSVDLIKRLIEEGASVRVVMTEASKNFVTPLTLEIASGNKVHSGLFDDPMSHIALGRDSDMMLIAPATADIIGKFACGIADDLLSTSMFAFNGKVVIAPAMNWRMYENPVLRKNLDYLKGLGVIETPPASGKLACGEEGSGRMADTDAIIEAMKSALSPKDLSVERIVITAGPTREFMDSVRFISNKSSGKMGYALARSALRRGASVVLISGQTSLAPPAGVAFLPVVSAKEMREAVLGEIESASVLIMAAAVADFTPALVREGKPGKSDFDSLKLLKTPDILSEVGAMKKRPLLVGFSAEEKGNVEKARRERIEKGADIMVFNDITSPDSGFEAETNRIVIIESGGEEQYPLLSKEDAADAVLDRIRKRGA